MMFFSRFDFDEVKILKLLELVKKKRTEPQLRHVLDQWKIKGLAQDKYIKRVKEQLGK